MAMHKVRFRGSRGREEGQSATLCGSWPVHGLATVVIRALHHRYVLPHPPVPSPGSGLRV